VQERLTTPLLCKHVARHAITPEEAREATSIEPSGGSDSKRRERRTIPLFRTPESSPTPLDCVQQAHHHPEVPHRGTRSSLVGRASRDRRRDHASRAQLRKSEASRTAQNCHHATIKSANPAACRSNGMRLAGAPKQTDRMRLVAEGASDRSGPVRLAEYVPSPSQA
jgi:hypothetical protein